MYGAPAHTTQLPCSPAQPATAAPLTRASLGRCLSPLVSRSIPSSASLAATASSAGGPPSAAGVGRSTEATRALISALRGPWRFAAGRALALGAAAAGRLKACMALALLAGCVAGAWTVLQVSRLGW